ncbi:MAG TPA: hypothetical protein VFD49_13430 [Candidatus Dormibacteraeota bacterium]|nr:hypothetical protein [Candidatus Dormibacteraeota bacterium]
MTRNRTCVPGRPGPPPFEIDLEPVRRALARWRLASGARRAPVQDLAAETGLSRCTIWRFLSGRPVGLAAAGRITGVLGLDLHQVLRPPEPEPDPPGRALMEAARAVVEARERARAGSPAELDARIDELAELLDRPRSAPRPPGPQPAQPSSTAMASISIRTPRPNSSLTTTPVAAGKSGPR